jgi:hypothetical protein
LLKVGVSLECESFIVEGHEEAEGCDAWYLDEEEVDFLGEEGGEELFFCEANVVTILKHRISE